MADVTYPNVHVQLTGKDGNVFAVISAVKEALRREISSEAANQFVHDAMDQGSYREVLTLAMRTVNVS